MTKTNPRTFYRFLFFIALCVTLIVTTQAQESGDKFQTHAPTLTTTEIAVKHVNSRATQIADVVSPKKVPAIVTNNATKESSAAQPTAPNLIETYRIGSGDVLDIRLVNASRNVSTLYTVLAGGLLEFPLISDQPLHVNNLTTDEVVAMLIDELKRRDVNFTPQFIVNVREFASHTILVNGLVESPGAHVLRREAVPLYVVVAEAMPKRNAGRVTIISRVMNERRTVDFADASAMNMLVRTGDVLMVEERPREFFYIAGDVNAPGEKDFRAKMTLTQAILAAGGASQHGKLSARVARQNADGRLSSVEFNLKEIEAGNAPDPHLQSGDRIEVGKH
ncbi:MAG: hypothetical protein NVSMB56_11920 [Pyrinomonadaceae bacterium]